MILARNAVSGKFRGLWSFEVKWYKKSQEMVRLVTWGFQFFVGMFRYLKLDFISHKK